MIVAWGSQEKTARLILITVKRALAYMEGVKRGHPPSDVSAQRRTKGIFVKLKKTFANRILA